MGFFRRCVVALLLSIVLLAPQDSAAQYFGRNKVQCDQFRFDILPTIWDLSRGPYFPCRFGQAYMTYVGGTYGDGAVTSLYRVAGRAGVEEGLQTVTGMTGDSLSADWRRPTAGENWVGLSLDPERRRSGGRARHTFVKDVGRELARRHTG